MGGCSSEGGFISGLLCGFFRGGLLKAVVVGVCVCFFFQDFTYLFVIDVSEFHILFRIYICQIYICEI